MRSFFLDNPMEITSPWGERIHPIYGTKKMHWGIDFRAYYEKLCAPEDGTVCRINYADDAGHFCTIKLPNGKELIFCHLSNIQCNIGDFLTEGQVFATTGDSGTSSGAHLHFGIKDKVGGKFIDPTSYALGLQNSTNEAVADLSPPKATIKTVSIAVVLVTLGIAFYLLGR